MKFIRLNKALYLFLTALLLASCDNEEGEAEAYEAGYSEGYDEGYREAVRKACDQFDAFILPTDMVGLAELEICD